MVDAGYLIFVEILRITEYPGAPFTGEIVRDLIMFLLIPTIFIILFIYILLGRMNIHNMALRLLLGIGVYLYIVAGGYFRGFALFAGPYFIVLIFILGIFYFVTSHFRVGGDHRAAPGGAHGGEVAEHTRSYEAARKHLPHDISKLLGVPELNLVQRKRITDRIKLLDKGIADLEKQLASMGQDAHGRGDVIIKLNDFKTQRNLLEYELESSTR